MLSGIGVSGSIVMGHALILEDSHKAELEKYLERVTGDTIVVASDLTKEQALIMNRFPIVGFVTEKGGENSHLAIQARKKGLAAVFDVSGCMDFINNGDMLLVDGINGSVMIEPRKDTVEKFMKLKKKIDEEEKRVSSFAGRESVSKDGYRYLLTGNIDEVSDIDQVLKNGGEGIGLFRTEGIYANREVLPTESEQYEIYLAASEKMKGKTVTIRTLDIGGDHFLSYMDMEKESNPFLGCRGIRFSFRRPDIFKTQCRAILRASAHGAFRILLPMLSSLLELQRAKNIIKSIMDELKAEGIDYDKRIPIGVMIETPAAAWMADLFAEEADFLSIGTNDLTQYTVACDRGNRMVSRLYSNYHPAVLRSIKYTIECAKKFGKPVSICGEAGSDPLLVPLFLLYGVDELSVSPTMILTTREKASKTDLKTYANLDGALNKVGTIEDAQSCLEAFSALG